EADAGSLCDAAQGGAGAMGPADVASAAGTAGPNDTTDPPTRRALAARSPIRFAVRRAEGAFLPLPPVLFLVLEPRQKSRRGAEGPEFEDDLAVLRVLRVKQDAFALVDHVGRLLERDFVVVLSFLPTRQVEPLHVEEQESPPGLPDPPLPRLDESLLRDGDGLEDR